MQASKSTRIGLALALSAAVAGCAGRQTTSYDEERLNEARSELAVRDEAMRERTIIALTSMSESTRMLAELRNAQQMVTMTPTEIASIEYNSSRVPPRMSASVTMLGAHHPAEALDYIARQTMYTFVEIGVEPPGGSVVTMPGTRSAHDHVRNIGAQLGDSAMIRTIVGSATIELDWTYGATN